MIELATVLVPHENVNDESATLSKWLVADGATVAAGQPLAVLETSKTNFEVVAPIAGVVRYAHAIGSDIPIGSELCTVGPANSAATVTKSMPIVEKEVANIGSTTFAEPRFSAAARSLLEEHKIDAKRFVGRGMVQARDVMALVSPGGAPSRRVVRPTPPAPLPQSRERGEKQMPIAAHRSEPLSRAKRTEIKYLTRGQEGTLASNVSVAIPTRGLRAAAELGNSPAGLTAVIIFETARLLRKYPLFNACYSDGAALIYDDVNIGVAVDAGRGLKVPVLHAADTQTAPQLQSAFDQLLIAYADDTLPAASLSGGTFTVTDLSSEGTFGFVPLINQGQSAILGVGGEVEMPAGRVFQLTLSFDHRLTEGRMAGQLLNDLRTRLMAFEAALAPKNTDGPSCTRCLRSHQALSELHANLLQSIGSDGRTAPVCTLCLAGW